MIDINLDHRSTNADRIRSMDDGDLAFLAKVKADYQCISHEFPDEENWVEWQEWLQQQAE